MGKGALRILGIGLLAIGAAFAGCSETEETGGGGATATGTGGGQSSSTGGTGGVTSSTSNTGGDPWIDCPVEYTNITGECDLINQDCPAGQWCDVAGSDGDATLICKPHFGGLKTAGQPCDETSECSVGMLCIEHACAPACCPENDVPCESGTCDVHVHYGAGQFAMRCSYLVACVVLTADCPEGFDCHIANAAAGVAVCDQPSDNQAAEGEPCDYRNDCGESQHCNKNPPDEDPDAGVIGRCRYYCHVDTWQNEQPALGGCPQTPVAQSCHDIDLQAFPGLGLCVPD